LKSKGEKQTREKRKAKGRGGVLLPKETKPNRKRDLKSDEKRRKKKKKTEGKSEEKISKAKKNSKYLSATLAQCKSAKGRLGLALNVVWPQHLSRRKEGGRGKTKQEVGVDGKVDLRPES
jgi:hypothetical protein